MTALFLLIYVRFPILFLAFPQNNIFKDIKKKVVKPMGRRYRQGHGHLGSVAVAHAMRRQGSVRFGGERLVGCFELQ